MNIFRILSSNDGSINEPNVSSFLAYLLDPNEDHGISSLLLQEILKEFIGKDEKFLSKIKFGNRITDLSKFSNFTVNIIPELSVKIFKDKKEKRRDIDILIEIIENKSKEILYSICLENKITDSSINKRDSQLEDELKGLKSLYSESGVSPEIYVIYLTPYQSKISTDSFEKFEYEKKHHLYWDNNDENSVFNKLINIFNKENEGLIDPINNQSSYLIKSFLSFIKTNFKSYVRESLEDKLEKKNYGKPVFDLLFDFAATLKFDEEFEIKNIKDQFSQYVLEVSGKELEKGTRDPHIIGSIVNNEKRGHNNVKKPDEARKNIFYYSDESRKKVKRFNSQNDKNVKVYFGDGHNPEFIFSEELNEMQLNTVVHSDRANFQSIQKEL